MCEKATLWLRHVVSLTAALLRQVKRILVPRNHLQAISTRGEVGRALFRSVSNRGSAWCAAPAAVRSQRSVDRDFPWRCEAEPASTSGDPNRRPLSLSCGIPSLPVDIRRLAMDREGRCDASWPIQCRLSVTRPPGGAQRCAAGASALIPILTNANL